MTNVSEHDVPIVIFLMVLTLFSSGMVLFLLVKALFESKNWSAADGIVLRTSTSSSDSIGRLPTCYAHIFWSYAVEGQAYNGKMAIAYFSARTAQQVIETYKADTAVKVYFNPSQPSQSTLRIKNPGTWVHWILTVLSTLGFLSLLMAAGYMVFD
ncbi:DUF3592 domain-containing protein [Deinococcus hohokamensis]|uniref:DUF3592 domain-containing protein n=1 Tax=Deinococcus hohokamensis TaxID=309883 RepID=A0ABV9I7K4_9DEIO